MIRFLKPALWVRDKARNLTQDQRSTLYKVAATLVPLLAAAGYIADGTAQMVLTVLGLLLGTGAAVVAKSNTPKVEDGSVVRTFKPAD